MKDKGDNDYINVLNNTSYVNNVDSRTASQIKREKDIPEPLYQ